MDSVERVLKICKDRNIPISKLEKECGFSNGYIRGLRRGKFTTDRAKIIAEYLNIDYNWLIDGTNPQPTITTKDEKDIKKKLDDIRNQLASDTGLMYDGEPIDEESQEAILAAIEVAERTAILEAKRKFTPNKYKK